MDDAHGSELRALLQRAVQYGRAHLSVQTQFLHYYPHSFEGEAHDSIPVAENMLFALALIRLKTVDSVSEGVELLKRLLPFQLENGQFPLYIHQYPAAHDAYLGRRILVIFYFLLRDFAAVIDAESTTVLKRSARRLSAALCEALEEATPPPWIRIPSVHALQMMGGLFEDDAFHGMGEQHLAAAWSCVSQDTVFESQHAAELVLALGWTRPETWPAAAHGFWEQFCAQYDPLRGVYCGPCIHERAYDALPMPSLYDLLCSFHWGRCAAGLNFEAGHLLLAALIDHRLDPTPGPAVLSASCLGNAWERVLSERSSTVLCDRTQFPPEPTHPGFHALRVHWIGAKGLHVAALQLHRSVAVRSTRTGATIVYDLELPPLEDEGRRARAWPLGLYLDHHPGLRLLLAGKQATVFELGQRVDIEADGLKASVVVTCVEGQGRWMLHVQRGARPAERHLSGDARYGGRDTCLLLRTVEQAAPVRLRLEWTMQDGG
ncbi:MAG: hypothetical protein KDK78_03365 [Chlamydiia bacterium]|nr:hypothetical protein [Chlamydiia bacterium]